MNTLIRMVALVLLSHAVQAQVPRQLSFQGHLTDAAAVPISGAIPMTFKLYASPNGGGALFTETQTVAVTNGVYNVLLGSSTPLDAPFDVSYYLGVTVGADAEMTPRVVLSAAPYALRADSLAATATVPGTQITGSAGTIPQFDDTGRLGPSVLHQSVTGTVGLGSTVGPYNKMQIGDGVLCLLQRIHRLDQRHHLAAGVDPRRQQRAGARVRRLFRFTDQEHHRSQRSESRSRIARPPGGHGLHSEGRRRARSPTVQEAHRPAGRAGLPPSRVAASGIHSQCLSDGDESGGRQARCAAPLRSRPHAQRQRVPPGIRERQRRSTAPGTDRGDRIAAGGADRRDGRSRRAGFRLRRRGAGLSFDRLRRAHRAHHFGDAGADTGSWSSSAQTSAHASMPRTSN
jgi:hypothetical protein